jgi:membrane-associated phospholipid phosphatase
LAWFSIYNTTNRIACASTRLVHLTPPEQYWPWIILPGTTVVYLLGGILLPFIPFAVFTERRQIWFVIVAYALVSAAAFSTYLAWPLTIERPEINGDRFDQQLLRQVYQNDLPGNCLPSSHVTFAVLAALLVAHSRLGRLVIHAVVLLAILVSLSTVTTGQHYIIDVVAGVVLAFGGFHATRYLVGDIQSLGAATGAD